MREYESIWIALKSSKSKSVQISAPKSLHRRVIKAVTKEKWKDLGYKIMLEPKVAIMTSTTKNSIITFTLKHSIDWNEL